MKRWLALLIFAGCLPAATIGINPPITNVAPGTPFTINVTISNVVDLFAFQFDIGFTPGLLSAGTPQDGGFLASNFFAGLLDNTAGTIQFISDSLTGPGPGRSGSGTLASIQFLLLAAGTSAITIDNALLLDSNLNDIAGVTVVNGRVNAGNVPEPGAAALWLAGAGILAGWKLRRGRSWLT